MTLHVCLTTLAMQTYQYILLVLLVTHIFCTTYTFQAALTV